ncbi:MAG: MlaD family protein [Gilvibacter sp.]
MKLSREVRTGILAIAAIVLFIFGYNYLKGSDLFNPGRTFYAKYEHVGGLAPSAPVSINGLDVGKVSSINFDSRGDLIVTMSVSTDLKFSKISTAKIFSGGLIGGRSIAILPDYSTNDYAKSGDTLKSEVEKEIMDAVSDRLIPIEEKVNATLTQLDTLMLGINSILDDESQENLKQTIRNLNATSGSFKSTASQLNTLMSNNADNLDRTFSNLDKTAENFATLSDSLAKIEIGGIVSDLEDTMAKFNGIIAAMEAGEGSVGKLLKDDELYDNLSGASSQLEQLLEDMKLNPKRYVHFSLFGKRPKQYESTENNPE